MTVIVSSNLAGVAVAGLTFSADSDTLAVTTSSAASIRTSARCTTAITVNESVTVDVVGGEGVAVTVGVSFAVKNFIFVVSLGTFGFGGGGIAWTIICNVYS
jgi:hypothetical protein